MRNNWLNNRKRRPTHPGEILREDILPAPGLTQDKLARLLGVSRRTISEILHERRPVVPTWRIAWHVLSARRQRCGWVDGRTLISGTRITLDARNTNASNRPNLESGIGNWLMTLSNEG